jgi:hypothetical protein
MDALRGQELGTSSAIQFLNKNNPLTCANLLLPGKLARRQLFPLCSSWWTGRGLGQG